MSESNIWSRNVRFDLDDEMQKKAYEYLKNMDRKEFGSYSKVCARALVCFFDDYYKKEEDPYLETREKEEKFIDQILQAVENGIKEAMPHILAGCFVQMIQPFEGKNVMPVNMMAGNRSEEADQWESGEDEADDVDWGFLDGITGCDTENWEEGQSASG